MSKTEITYDSLPPFAPHLDELTPETSGRFLQAATGEELAW
jgi:hypothetical protein